MRETRIYDLLIGLGVGVAAGLLLAPNAGKKTRARITKAATDGTAYAIDCGETVSEALLDFIDKGKDEIARERETVADAIKRGTHAYKRAIN
jgi:gas vesicle protein